MIEQGRKHVGRLTLKAYRPAVADEFEAVGIEREDAEAVNAGHRPKTNTLSLL